MTLFITLPRRQYEISDAYVMALAFLITYSVITITKQVREKRRKKVEKLNTFRGGNLKLDFSDEEELGLTILTCIVDNENYLVTSQRIKDLIFRLVKAKIKNDSLVLTPNLIRFLALTLLKEDKTFITRVGSILISSNNRARLMIRTIAAAVLGSIGAAIPVLLPFSILMAISMYTQTEFCGYKCDAHFQKLPQNEPIEIYEERQNGHLVIAGNDDARKVEIYVSSPSAKKIVKSNKKTCEKVITQRYRPARKKAKQVNFSDFRKTDPVLSEFKNLEEPYIPKKSCAITDAAKIRLD